MLGTNILFALSLINSLLLLFFKEYLVETPDTTNNKHIIHGYVKTHIVSSSLIPLTPIFEITPLELKI